MLIAPLLALSACKVTDAPHNLEALMVYGFTHFDDEDKYLEATAEQLVPLIAPHEEEMTKDGYRVNDLTKADLAQAGVDAGDVTGITGAMGLADYTHKVKPVIDVASAENKHQIWPEKFIEFEVLDTSDRDCFFSHECNRLDQTVHETADAGLLGDATRTYTNSYRWVEETDTTPEGVFIRTLSPDPIDLSSGLANIFQQYSFAFVYARGKDARRVEAFWVDIEVIGVDVPDSESVKLVVNTMGKQAECIDDYLNGVENDCK